MVTDFLQPEKVFKYFGEICSIPHPSYQLDAICKYLVKFAQSHELKHLVDNDGNVVMIKQASEGYEKQPAIILQGHMDMVAVSTPDSEVNPEWQGLQLAEEDGFLYAKGTSLGGDDGIAIAYMLAILDSDDIAHPRIEAVFTTNEEVGMEGALGIDMSKLYAKRLINIDSEEEGILLVGCAGGIRMDASVPVKRDFYDGKKLQIHVDGLLGGHSGTEIHKERGNSNCLMGRVLNAIAEEGMLLDLQGGLKDNAIPRVTSALVLVQDERSEERIENTLRKLRVEFLKEYWGRDDGINITWAWTPCSGMHALTPESTKKVANFLVAAPNGVISMSSEMQDVVETSLNMGIIRLEQDELHVGFSLRSLMTSEREMLQKRVTKLIGFFGGTVSESGSYPAWTPSQNSKLKDKMVRVYKEQYGREPIVTVVHAGLECGILAQKIPELDCISIGPDILSIHTTEEKLDIESTKRVWDYLLAVLADKEYPEVDAYPVDEEIAEELWVDESINLDRRADETVTIDELILLDEIPDEEPEDDEDDEYDEYEEESSEESETELEEEIPDEEPEDDEYDEYDEESSEESETELEEEISDEEPEDDEYEEEASEETETEFEENTQSTEDDSIEEITDEPEDTLSDELEDDLEEEQIDVFAELYDDESMQDFVTEEETDGSEEDSSVDEVKESEENPSVDEVKESAEVIPEDAVEEISVMQELKKEFRIENFYSSTSGETWY